MPQAIWKGHISFGLVSIPVALYSAERRSDLSFHMLDSRNQARIRYERVNAETGHEVPREFIVKGFEYDKGNYVVLDDEDFQNAAPEATRSIDIEQFVDLDAVSYLYFDRPYYLVPEDKGKGYVLLRDTLKAANKAGIAKVVLRNRQHLAALIPQGDALVLNLLRFDQELRRADEFKLPSEAPGEHKVSKREQDMAAQLIDAMSGAWRPAEFHDEYREALLNYIEQKAKKGKTAVEPAAKKASRPTAEVIDFTERLRKSLEVSRRGAKGGGTKKAAATGKAKTRQRRKKTGGGRKKTGSRG